MFESIFTTAADSTLSFSGLMMALGTALVLGLLIALTYMKTHKTATPSQSFAITLVMLPAVVTVIILLVGSNVARAFSLAGAFAIIRFRSAPGDPKDITFVLFSMAVGLATGMGFLLYGAAVAVLLCGVMLLLDRLRFGKPKGQEMQLKILTPEDLNFDGAFDPVLQKYTHCATLQRVKTVDLGSLYELCYAVVLRPGTSPKTMMDELRCRNGNLNITLTLAAPPAEF